MKKAENAVSDHDILESIRSDRNLEPTVHTLYNHYFDGLAAYIRSNQGNDQDAEDFFQESIIVFIDAVKQHKFRGDSKIKTFLHAVMRNLWLNELKRRKRALHRETRYYEENPQVEDSVHQQVKENEAKLEVASLLEKLGENCQKILHLFYYLDKPMKEIYLEMGYENEQIARNMKYKCMKKMHKLLDANEDIRQHFKNLLVNG
jgi:RNA polymerase sigma factor (sigma-70 family)